MENKNYIALFEKYLRNETSEEETQLLLSMLRRDKDLDQYLERRLDQSHPEIDAQTEQRMHAQIRSTIAQGRKRSLTTASLRRAMQWAAMIVLPLLSALLVYLITSDQLPGNNRVTITAPNGEKAIVTLADGSRVWINSGSSLTYGNDFNRRQRKVSLEGEAYFEVAKDPQHPFIVHTREMEIQALGTAFNVSAYSDEHFPTVVLVEGKIKVNTREQEEILTENERAIVDKANQSLSTDRVFASDFIQWKDGNLYFDNSSFDEIAQTLSRVFNVEIRFASEKLRPLRFTGTLGNSSIRNALDILSLTSAMHYEMNGTVIELYYRD
jgi:ferric-dicitrate binding protein FerR (iron transport regulator)